MVSKFNEDRFGDDGFTLVELIVTISLITVFIASAFAYNRTADQQISLFREQGRVVNEFYNARSLAIATYSRTGQDRDLPCGYGIHIASSTAIVLFKYLPDAVTGVCNDPISGDIFYTDPQSQDVETVNLVNVTLQTASGENIGPGNEIDILFVPPDPKVYSNLTSFPETPVTIFLHASQISTNLSIIINEFGQITVQ